MVVTSSLDYLKRKLEIKAGFLNPRCPFVYLNEREDDSYWNYHQNFIQLGIESILRYAKEKLERLSELLLYHEVSHTLNTDPETTKKIDFPFPILNILEDERIERLMHRDFRDLHKFSYDTFYLMNPPERLKEMRKNPYNIGVLLRWRRWGVEIKTEKPDTLTEEEYEEFLKDWEDALEKSAHATSTEEVAKIGKALYEKWKKVFGTEAPPTTCTGIEGSEKDFGEGREDDEEKMGEGNGGERSEGTEHGRDELGRPPEECTPSDSWKLSHPAFEWDREWINRTISELKRYLKLPSYTEAEYRLTGRRIDPKRAENLLPPFKRRESIEYSLSKKKLLIVIDNSGSMSGEPKYYACHTAYVLAKLFKVHIVMTCTKTDKPIWIQKLDDMRYIETGGAENYRSLKDLPLKYDFTLFLTDACVNSADWKYAQNLSLIRRIGAGYVKEHRNTAVEDALRKVFGRYFYSKPDRVAVEIGLFLKRLFLKRG